MKTHGLDTDRLVCFYEQEFYPLSNFSAFSMGFDGVRYPTSEHAYQAQKFIETDAWLAMLIQQATSAHEAFKIAENHQSKRRADWDSVKVSIMRSILIAKVEQHEYVRRKLLQSADRRLAENSWRDSFWGWGADQQGMNMLGKLWMDIRAELLAKGRKK